MFDNNIVIASNKLSHSFASASASDSAVTVTRKLQFRYNSAYDEQLLKVISCVKPKVGSDWDQVL